MADERRRIYYTKAQTLDGLVTNGNEWMFTDNTEYIGQYHKYTTGEVFSEPSYIKGKSRKLIPYVGLSEIRIASGDISLNSKLNSEYNVVKNIDVPKSVNLNPSKITPTLDDFKNGYVLRYFAFKVNDGQLVELDKDGYGKVGTDDGFDAILWRKFEMKWKIVGPEYDVLNSRGDIEESGIIDTNMRTAVMLSETYPTLISYITDYREFSKL
jgi:hypothetical protein